MRRIALYIRVSTEEQARVQDGSLVSQRKRLEEYVDGQNRREAGWGKIVSVYCDEGKSAKDMNRPEFQTLLRDIKTGKVNLVLATELSRLSRSIKDFCVIWDLFKKHNASFITLREQFDTTTAAGEMMVFNLVNFAQFERKQTAERISANCLSRAKRGLWNGGSIPLGYDRNPKHKGELIPNTGQAKQVKEIFEIFMNVKSVRKTCLELSKRGIFSKRYVNRNGIEKGGSHFTTMSLQRILTNRTYIGVREIGVKKGEVEVVKASWPAIIDLELFNQVQERLKSNKNKYKPDEWKTYPFPLTELLICGECGKHLGGKSGHGNNGKHYYYGHPRQLHTDGVNHLKRCQLENIRAPRIEEIILQSLKKVASDPGIIDQWFNIYTQGTLSEIPAIEGRLKTVELNIQTHSKRVDNLASRLADLPKEVPADLIYNQIRIETEKVKELEATRNDLLHRRTVLTTQAIDREGLLFRIRRTIANLEKTPVEHRRPVYANLIKFAEMHLTKIKLGVYAPTVPAERVGSCTVSIGAAGGT